MKNRLSHIIEKGKDVWNTTLDGYTIIKEIDSKYLYANIAKGIIEACLPYVLIIFSGTIVNQLILGSSGGDIFISLFISLLLELLFSLLKEQLNAEIMIHANEWNMKSSLYLSEIMNSIDYQYFENGRVSFLKNKVDVQQNANSGGIVFLIKTIGNVMNSICCILIAIAMNAYLSMSTYVANNCCKYALMIINFFIFLGLLLNICVKTKEEKKEQGLWRQLPEANKKIHYYEKYLKDDSAQVDVRVFKQKNFIMKEIGKWTEGPVYLNDIKKLNKKYGKITVILNIFIVWACFLKGGINVFYGNMMPGSFVQSVLCYENLFINIGGLSVLAVSYIHNSIYLKDYMELIKLKKEKTYIGEKKTIEIVDNNKKSDTLIFIKNIYFSYNLSKNPVIKNISVELKKNRKYVLVGENGSGKTTFVKILCGLFEIQNGTIQVLDKYMQSTFSSEYRRELCSMVFQDFQLFPFSLAQNIAANKDVDEDKIFKILDLIGMKEWALNLADGIHTNLSGGFEKNGIRLSGGEEQKIAIARALYKDSDILILDEPTAALDVESEYKIYQLLANALDNKTVIFVTHRLAACEFCDEILVFDDGNIIEKGDHESLLRRNGKYKKMWETQMKYFD